MPSCPRLSPTDCPGVSRVALSLEGWPGDPFPCFARTHGQEVCPWGWPAMLPPATTPSLHAFVRGVPEGGERVVKGMADGTE